MTLELIVAVVAIIALDVAYTRMESLHREITHILTMLAMAALMLICSSENQELKKQLKEQPQKIRVELVSPDSVDPDQLREQLAEMVINLNSEVSSGTASTTK